MLRPSFLFLSPSPSLCSFSDIFLYTLFCRRHHCCSGVPYIVVNLTLLRPLILGPSAAAMPPCQAHSPPLRLAVHSLLTAPVPLSVYYPSARRIPLLLNSTSSSQSGWHVIYLRCLSVCLAYSQWLSPFSLYLSVRLSERASEYFCAWAAAVAMWCCRLRRHGISTSQLMLRIYSLEIQVRTAVQPTVSGCPPAPLTKWGSTEARAGTRWQTGASQSRQPACVPARRPAI